MRVYRYSMIYILSALFGHIGCLFLPAGWAQFHIYRSSTERDRNTNQSKLTATLKPLLDKVRNHKCAGLLHALENAEDVVTLEEIVDNHRNGEYYRSKEALGADLLRLVSF